MHISLVPVYIIDICGSLAMLFLSALSLRQAFRLYHSDPENPLHTYILWLIIALFSFCMSRPMGHLVKHILVFSNNAAIWSKISPYSGGLNTITFVVIFASTLFFGNMLVIMNRMTKDRHKVEQTSAQLLELNKDIESVVSDRTRAELALQLAHEIRNPVMVISGFLHRMSFRENKRERNRKYREAVLDQTKKLEAIVYRFEQLQSGEHEHFSVIEINALTEDGVKILQAEADLKGVGISFLPTENNLFCQGDTRYLKVALLHILRNALEACKAGDKIRVETQQIPEGAAIMVSDNGPGIPAEVLEHIFEPFYSTKAGYTGLGLPYVRQIIREHRGEIHIDSTYGHGCTVTITLPSHLKELQRGIIAPEKPDTPT
ncbi:MAG TPA: HAMP domain-containing histidine kinase [Desulfobulbaceae bacterium]|nr:HAMP domain-containing histidine kinase [Desulfobulbaceae bacterium]HHD63237.1 HAMP domain-containing histidine kinase [Desulfobulbaceae bacterium]